MRNLIRTPLTWLVIAELVVAGALVVVAWNTFSGSVRPAAASSFAQRADAGVPAGPSLPGLPALGKRAPGPPPGLNVESAFWRARLAQLNQDQVFLERLEWQIVHAAIAACERYVQTVVVPAIQRAEHAR